MDIFAIAAWELWRRRNAVILGGLQLLEQVSKV
jgi:hypothetical protein